MGNLSEKYITEIPKDDCIHLVNYDSSEKGMTLSESISLSESNNYVINQLTHWVSYEGKLKINDENILYNYKNYLMQYCIDVTIPNNFFYRPEYVAKDIYGTVDLWWFVLFFNDIECPMHFNKKNIKIYDPTKFTILNTLISTNKKYVNWKSDSPDYIEDITIKPVKVRNTIL